MATAVVYKYVIVRQVATFVDLFDNGSVLGTRGRHDTCVERSSSLAQLDGERRRLIDL